MDAGFWQQVEAKFRCKSESIPGTTFLEISTWILGGRGLCSLSLQLALQSEYLVLTFWSMKAMDPSIALISCSLFWTLSTSKEADIFDRNWARRIRSYQNLRKNLTRIQSSLSTWKALALRYWGSCMHTHACGERCVFSQVLRAVLGLFPGYCM